MPILVFNGFSGLASGPISFSLGLFLISRSTKSTVSIIRLAELFPSRASFHQMGILRGIGSLSETVKTDQGTTPVTASMQIKLCETWHRTIRGRR